MKIIQNKVKITMLLFFFVCFLLTGLSFASGIKLYKSINEENTGYLQEISMRVGYNVDQIIENNYDGLYLMATTLNHIQIKSFEEAQNLLSTQKEFCHFQKILLVDKDGKTYDLNNKEVFVSFDDSVRESILTGKHAMSTTQIINNEEFIFFIVPMENININGKEIVGLAGGYTPDSFSQILSMSSFSKQAYSQIITKSGTTVVRPTFEDAMKTGYNIFTSIEKAEFEKNDSFAIMKEDIQNNRASKIQFNLEGTSRYMVYTPIHLDEWYLVTFVPVNVVNEKSNMLLKTTTAICILITIIFVGLIISLFSSTKNNRKRLEKIAYVDEITEGNTIQKFYQKAIDQMEKNPQTQYALLYTNIEKFKVLNEQIGRTTCDRILWAFNYYMTEELNSNECMGRLSADNFCILVEYDSQEKLLGRLQNWFSVAKAEVEAKNNWTIPITEFGIYVIDNRDLGFPQMIDRAKLALKEGSKQINSRLRYSYYDDEVRRQLVRDKHLEDRMVEALREGEFKVYLQPKYLVQEEVIGGAEALVRWESADEGMIYPNEFIPLFEKNDFIIELDFFVFGEVCKQLRKWMDQGIKVMKISVNCSRKHFGDNKFLQVYCRLAETYNIPKHLLEIELTESIVLENSEKLTQIIDEIHSAGFECSMDDFGSGYSSLNLLQSIPVDTLKLDQIFFQKGENELERTEAVVGSIVQMAKALNIETVAEGVECRKQVNMLKKVGCDYIQGYVFAKPMKIEDFEILAFGRIVE